MYNLNIKLSLLNVFGDLTSMNICVIPEEYISFLYDVSYNGCMWFQLILLTSHFIITTLKGFHPRIPKRMESICVMQ